MILKQQREALSFFQAENFRSLKMAREIYYHGLCINGMASYWVSLVFKRKHIWLCDEFTEKLIAWKTLLCQRLDVKLCIYAVRLSSAGKNAGIIHAFY